MKTNIQPAPRALILGSLAALLATGVARADEERDLLLKVSVEKRDAIIVTPFSPSGAYAYGCFIGEDGLAVLALSSLTRKTAPDKYLLAGRRTLKAPTLCYISAEFGIAIAKFDYSPKVWIEPSAEAVPLGLQVAILDASGEAPLAVGPVSSKTMGMTANYLRPTFQPNFGIGAGLPAGRNAPPLNGSPIIDSTGRLRGTFHATHNTGSQILLNAISVEHWFAGIAEARQTERAIPIPVPPKLSPFDPAEDHPDFFKAVVASHQNNSEQAIKHVRVALRKHPESPLLRSLHFEEANIADKIDELLALAEATKPPAGGSDAQFVAYYLFLSKARRRTGDHEGAGAALRKGLEIAPTATSGIREEYARWLETDKKPEEALRYLREAVAASPDNIQLQTKLRVLLGQLKNAEEANRVRDRIFELEELYRRTSSVAARAQPKPLIAKDGKEEDRVRGKRLASIQTGPAIPSGPKAPTFRDYQLKKAAYLTDLLVESFRAHGHRDEAWSADAEKALRDFVALTQLNQTELAQPIRDLCEKCRQQGCEDPLVDLAWATSGAQLKQPGPKYRALMLAAGERGYPPAIYLYLGARFVQANPKKFTPPDDFDQQLEAYIQSPAARKLSRFTHDLVKQFARRLGRARLTALITKLERQPQPENDAYCLALGACHDRLAWAIRGGATINKVSAEARKAFGEHQGKAYRYYRTAWTIDPSPPTAAVNLLSITAAGKGGRDPEHRQWFDRAVKAELDNPEPYQMIIHYSLPRWGGSLSKMVGLAKLCIDTRRYDTAVPYTFRIILKQMINPHDGNRKILESPICHDMVSQIVDDLESGARKVRPDLYPLESWKSLQAMLAFTSGNLPEAKRIAGELGDKIDRKIFKEYGVDFTKFDRATVATPAEDLPPLFQQGAYRDATELMANRNAKQSHTNWFMKHVALQVWSGENAEHAVLCKGMLAAAADTQNAALADAIAKGSCLRQSDDAEIQAGALALARRTVELREEFPWYQMVLGMAEYRSGNYSAAEAALTKAEAQGKTQGEPYRSQILGTASYYRVLSLLKRDQEEEARKLFMATQETMKPLPFSEQHSLVGGADHNDLILWLVYKEAAALLEIGTLKRAPILCSDNFNVPDTADLNHSDQAGRRKGLNPKIQVRSSRGRHGISGHQLNLLRGRHNGRVGFQVVDDPDDGDPGPWHNWASGEIGAQILADQNLRIEFDWIAGNKTSNNWISLNVGYGREGAVESSKLGVNDSAADIGILFRFNGGTQVFDNGENMGVGRSFPPTVGVRHVTVDFAFDSFADGTPVTMEAWVDGTKVVDGRTFTWGDNAGELYMELGTLEDTLIDNLTISTVP